MAENETIEMDPNSPSFSMGLVIKTLKKKWPAVKTVDTRELTEWLDQGDSSGLPKIVLLVCIAVSISYSLEMQNHAFHV